MTPCELYEALWEKEAHEEDLALAHVKTVCETLRTQTALLINNNPFIKRQIRDPRKLFKFAWEKKSSFTPPQTYQEMKNMMKVMARLGKDKKQQKDGKGIQRRKRRNT